QIEMSAARDKLADCIAPLLLQEIAEQLERFIEMKCVRAAAKEIELATQLRTKRRPVAVERQADVVPLPSANDLLIQIPSYTIEELQRPTVLPSRTEDPLERCKLSTVLAHDLFLPGELFNARDLLAVHPDKILRRAIFSSIRVVCRARGCVDAGEFAKVDWVG